MPQIPTSADLPTVSSGALTGRAPRVPEIKSPAAGLATLGQSVISVSEQLKAAQDRIQSRRAAVMKARLLNRVNSAVSTIARDIETEQDLADPVTLTTFRDRSRQETDRALEEFGQMFPDAVDDFADLQMELGTIHARFGDDLAAKSAAAGRAAVATVIQEDVNVRNSVVLNDPSRVFEQIDAGFTYAAGFRGALKPGEEQAIEDSYVTELASTAVDAFLINLDPDSAEDILADPLVQQSLLPQDERRLVNRVVDVRERLREQDAGFTLGPQQIRFGPGGEMIARGAGLTAAGEIIEPTPRSDLLDETGAVKREASGEVRRTAAQLLGGTFDIQTGQMGGLTPDAAQAAQAIAVETERILETGEENSIAQAVSLATGRVPLPEQLSFADIADQSIGIIEGTAEEGPIEGELENAEARLPAIKASAIDVADATGIAPAVYNSIVNNLLGQLDPSLVDTDIVRARQRLALLEGEFISAFKRNPRLPVWEQIKLSRIFSGPSALRSPEGVREELRSIEARLSTEIEIQRNLLGAPVPIETKQQALSDIQTMAGFRARIREFNVTSAQAELKTPQDIEAATRGQVEAFVTDSSEQELDALPDAMRQAIQNRLSGGEE